MVFRLNIITTCMDLLAGWELNTYAEKLHILQMILDLVVLIETGHWEDCPLYDDHIELVKVFCRATILSPRPENSTDRGKFDINENAQTIQNSLEIAFSEILETL